MGYKLDFELIPVDRKPIRTHHKPSKYDPILDEFLSSNHKLVKVIVKGKPAFYLKNQIDKRIESRGLGDKVKLSTINGELYMEKTLS